MISKNISVLNKEKVLNNLVSAARKNTISRFILAAVILGLGLFVMISGFASNNTLYGVLGIFFVVASIVYFVLAIIQVIKAPKDILKANPEINEGDINYNYTFKEGSIEAIMTANGKKNIMKYDYSSVKKVKEFEDKYEILLKESQILYVYKDGFTGEKSEEIFRINLEKNKKKIILKIKE